MLSPTRECVWFPYMVLANPLGSTSYEAMLSTLKLSHGHVRGGRGVVSFKSHIGWGNGLCCPYTVFEKFSYHELAFGVWVGPYPFLQRLWFFWFSLYFIFLGTLAWCICNHIPHASRMMRNTTFITLSAPEWVFSHAGIDKEANYSVHFVNTFGEYNEAISEFNGCDAYLYWNCISNTFWWLASLAHFSCWGSALFPWNKHPKNRRISSQKSYPRQPKYENYTGDLFLSCQYILVEPDSCSITIPFCLNAGFSWGHLILAQDSTAETIWNNGG